MLKWIFSRLSRNFCVFRVTDVRIFGSDRANLSGDERGNSPFKFVCC